ncbi:MAG: hypothetical protein AB7O97_22250 [Planctomycetota bacterium]
MTGGHRTPPVRALVHAWLLLDFFGEARRSGGDASTLTTTIFSQSFLCLIVAALLYPEPPPVPFAAANLCLSTLLVALGAFDTEQPAQRRAADRLLLATAPFGAVRAVLARALHAAFATMLLTVGMALPPAILLACRQGQPLLAPGYLLAACACAALAIASLSVSLRAARRFVGGHAAALLAGTGKALVLAFGVALFALSLPTLQKDAAALPFGRLGAELLPPYHAAKILAAPAAEAWRALPWLAIAALLLVVAAWLGEDSRDRAATQGRPGPLLRLCLRCCRGQPERGIGAFTATMLWRSPGVRARVLPLLGVPAAFAFLALRGTDPRGQALFTTMALQFPAIYLPFVIAMLRQAEQQGSRWLFDSAPRVPLARVQRAAWCALVTNLLLPVHAVALLALLLLGMPPLHTTAASAFAFTIGALLARAMTRDLTDVPFSDDGQQGGLELGNLIAFGLVLAGLGAGVAMLPLALQFGAAAITAAALVGMLRPHGEAEAAGAGAP